MRPLPLTLAAFALLVLPFDLHAEDDTLDLRPQTSLITVFPADEQTPIFLDADRLSGHRNVEIQAEGECELRKRGQVINADQLIYNQVEDEVHAQGNVRIEQNGNVTTGPELKMKLETRQGYMREPVYTLAAAGSAWRGGESGISRRGPATPYPRHLYHLRRRQ